MTFDVFDLRDDVVNEYRDYVESFVHILDPRIDQFVRETLASGELWPAAVLQLNPAYEQGGTLSELANQGIIARETARFFGGNLRLHRHQREALEIALRGEPYLVSTGTGSGKSLTYLLPIVDHVFRQAPHQPGVRAIIVYPMNALINSQLEALESFQRQNWPDTPLRFGRYTGQEGDEQRKAIRENPPHILLTNYVMLEYLLLRPFERPLVEQATRNLRFLVLDELHVYRGRQGADVAMLMRRVRQRAGGQVQVIGTSATIASRGNRDQRRTEIAEVGSTLFGVPIPSHNVVDETLQRIATVAVPAEKDALRAAVEMAPPAAEEAAVKGHPLTAWVEETFGLATEDGRLIRRPPISFAEGLQRLVAASGLPIAQCDVRLRDILEIGNAVRLSDSGEPIFAFRLHQFLASGSSIYATLEDPGQRELTVEGQVVLPGTAGESAPEEAKLLFPLAFCRDCGQEHYLVSLLGSESDPRFIARSPLVNAPDVESAGTPGFLVLDPLPAGGDQGDESERLWAGSTDELPEHWLEARKSGWKVKKTYEPFVPSEVWVKPDGATAQRGNRGSVRAWYSPRPLMLCLRCRAAYDRRDKSDFRKLATLSQTGRSTATTVLTSATIGALRRAQPEDREANKVLSFTDNRQDASLQAGHLNDFAQVTMMRGALARALETRPELRFSEIGGRILESLDPAPAAFMREPRESGPGYTSARETMVDLLTYRAFEDLRRAWRVAQPNLEQVGRLRITYAGLPELAGDDRLWQNVPGMEAIDGSRREAVLGQLLDHLRGELAIDAESLREERTKALAQQVNQWLRAPWTIDRTERLRHSRVARLPGAARPAQDDNSFGMSAASAIGRFLRSRHRWGAGASTLTPAEVDTAVQGIVAALTGHILTEVRRNNEPFGVQLKADALRWTRGAGEAPPLDPVRSRAVHQRRLDLLSRKPNTFFDRLYGEPAELLAGVVGREHTGQVSSADRILREEEFRAGQLPALFCSPTMELGVDIKTLNVVHMRNVPPTPANYAQRGGRAGRGGRPALVLTFASQGNAHDTYYFRQKERMISGAVAPARMDLANRELVQAHLQAVWLATTGVSLGSTVEQVLDLADPAFPIQPDVRAQLDLHAAQRADVTSAFREIASADPSMTAASWFNDAWLIETVERAPDTFDRAFDRWRELYRAALQQRNEARLKIDRPRLPRHEREVAERMEREAKRDIALLLNDGDVTETDFYPYRYLATEGFLPGYNFPRLPLRVLLNVRDESRSIDRPRFLGLSEFGPWNVIYHEGRKYRVTSQLLPAGGLESRITSAQLCKECGYIHPDGDDPVNICQGCGVAFDAQTRDFPQGLLDQSTARARPYDRISSDEEDRSREGYTITTHFQFAPGESPRRAVARRKSGSAAAPPAAADLLTVEFAPRAEVWRINHGWKRSVHQQGFTIDPDSGWWAKKENDEVEGQDPGDPAGTPSRGNIKPYVTDIRNVLLLRPETPEAADEAFLKTLAYALQRGIQVVYQVEEREVEVELIGRGANERLMLWEAAEGGTGVWDRIMDDPASFAQVAKEALRACHFSETGDPDPAWVSKCALACYDCLLSYSNQREHRLLNRQLVRNYLVALANSTLLHTTVSRGYDEQFAWLMERVDPGSSLERDFLEFLHRNQMRLPDATQTRPAPEIPVQTDFYYERDGRPGACIFLDGPHHQQPRQAARDQETREALEDRGFSVIAVRSGVPFSDQTMGYGEVFGGVA